MVLLPRDFSFENIIAFKQISMFVYLLETDEVPHKVFTAIITLTEKLLSTERPSMFPSKPLIVTQIEAFGKCLTQHIPVEYSHTEQAFICFKPLPFPVYQAKLWL